MKQQVRFRKLHRKEGNSFLDAEVISKDTNSDVIKARGQKGHFNEGSTGLRELDLAGGQQWKEG